MEYIIYQFLLTRFQKKSSEQGYDTLKKCLNQNNQFLGNGAPLKNKGYFGFIDVNRTVNQNI